MTVTSVAVGGHGRVGPGCPQAGQGTGPGCVGGSPVFEVYANGVGAWAVSRYADVRAVLADTSGFSSRRGPGDTLPGTQDSRPALDVLPGMFVHQDSSAHLDYRRLLAREFSVTRTRRLAGRIGRMAQTRLDAMTAAGAPADLVADYALPLCSEAVCDVLGVAWTKTTAAEILRLFAGQDLSNPDLYATGTPIDDFALDLARQIVKTPGRRPGLLSRIAGRQVPGGRIGEAELAGVAKLVLLAGHVSPTHMLALGAITLLEDHRDWYAALDRDAACAAAVVEELLRHITIKQFGLIRRATRDTQVAGVLIREGEWVVCSLQSGADHLDAQPDDFDPVGHGGGHLSFGHGPHQCLGQSLSRVVLEEGLTALSRRRPGLRLAVPRHQLSFRDDKTVHGVERLPVTW